RINQLRNNETLRELIAGAVLYCLIWAIPLLIFTDRKLYQLLGLIIGLIVCIALSVNMADTIDVAVDMDEKGAKSYLTGKASIRYLCVCAVTVLLAVTGIGNPLTFFAGIMGLKIGAYMQPLTHKAFEKLRNNKRGESVDG
ncbi:MAG: ATP synthase subunit I, partial [Lachnospiraceae bacterium]|nr:ATP synthase subunit I [Lachnospiraceae bacterium]